jgi:hypothetical protein
MTPALRVPEDMLVSVREFVRAQGMALDVLADGDCAVRVVAQEPGERLESDLTTLWSGGWIACPTALALAARLDVSPRLVGALMDLLNIKIRACALGCFK